MNVNQMNRLKIEDFIMEHICEDWVTLLTQSPYNLLKDEDNDYILFKYNLENSDFNEEIVREARGIVIDKHSLKAVALSFRKFWNVQEPYHDDIDWKNCRVQEKIDGSKILVWYDRRNRRWRLSTSGMLDAFKAEVNGFRTTYGELFSKALSNVNTDLETFYNCLKDSYCYTFELVSPESRIVVPYKKTRLYFIGLRDVTDMVELNPDLDVEVINLGLLRPREYNLCSLEDCMTATNKMGFDEEGFVVVDKEWRRVKIKSPAYVAAHYLRSNGVTSYSKVLDMVESGRDKQFLEVYPEYKDKFDEVREALKNFKNRLKQAIMNLQDNLTHMYNLDRKSLADYINTNNRDISGFLFKFIDTDLINLFIDIEWDKLFKNKKLSYLGFKEERDVDEFREE